MNFIPSINIELNNVTDFQYIVTENAKLVAGNIANSFNSGHHSFSIIGTYGTGKSSFILALEDDLKCRRKVIVQSKIFGDVEDFEFLKIVGDYKPLRTLLSEKLGVSDSNPLEALALLYKR